MQYQQYEADNNSRCVPRCDEEISKIAACTFVALLLAHQSSAPSRRVPRGTPSRPSLQSAAPTRLIRVETVDIDGFGNCCYGVIHAVEMFLSRPRLSRSIEKLTPLTNQQTRSMVRLLRDPSAAELGLDHCRADASAIVNGNNGGHTELHFGGLELGVEFFIVPTHQGGGVPTKAGDSSSVWGAYDLWDGGHHWTLQYQKENGCWSTVFPKHDPNIATAMAIQARNVVDCCSRLSSSSPKPKSTTGSSPPQVHAVHGLQRALLPDALCPPRR